MSDMSQNKENQNIISNEIPNRSCFTTIEEENDLIYGQDINIAIQLYTYLQETLTHFWGIELFHPCRILILKLTLYCNFSH